MFLNTPAARQTKYFYRKRGKLSGCMITAKRRLSVHVTYLLIIVFFFFLFFVFTELNGFFIRWREEGLLTMLLGIVALSCNLTGFKKQNNLRLRTVLTLIWFFYFTDSKKDSSSTLYYCFSKEIFY